jgi:hypothetical protein
LSWDFVRADPITYRAIDGAVCFEITLAADNRKNAIRVTRTEGDKFKIKIFREHGKALRWCEKHPWRYESSFGLFRL